MLNREPLPKDIRHRPKRRSARVNSHTPVILEWGSNPIDSQRTEARTRVVNFYGCLLVAPHDLALGQRLRLTNAANNRCSDAAVVWRGKERTEGFELGVELLNPGTDFWGLEI